MMNQIAFKRLLTVVYKTINSGLQFSNWMTLSKQTILILKI